MAWVDQKNGLVADTVYCDNELVAKDVAFKLPEITFATAESQAMGAMETPLIGLVEAMEATFTKIGIDLGLVKASTPEKHNYEIRYVQNNISGDGASAPVWCKAFITGVPKGVPAVEGEVGSGSEHEIALAVYRYQLYVNGEELICVDKLNSICRINGKDYFSEIAKHL